MPQLAMDKWGYSPEETLVIGDRIYTDVKSAINAGVYSMLVLSGETTKEVLEASEDKPTFVLDDAGELLKILKKVN
jgi:4-nitrophenyl phosphatase/NagD protein